MIQTVGITERGDAALDLEWQEWVQKGKPAILITKDPSTLYEILRGMKNELFSPNVIVHCTITGWGGTEFEPNVPNMEVAMNGYVKIAGLIGLDRTVLRIDPVFPIADGLKRALYVRTLSFFYVDFPGRIRISFLDNYEHIKKRFEAQKIMAFDYDFHAPLEVRKKMWEELGKPEVCGEPGFPCTGCVSAIDCKILGVEPSENDKGQRLACACLANKKELLTRKHPCPHNCIYCYWKKDGE